MGLLDILGAAVETYKNVEQGTRNERLRILENAERYGQQNGQRLKPEYQREMDRLREQQRQPWDRN